MIDVLSQIKDQLKLDTIAAKFANASCSPLQNILICCPVGLLDKNATQTPLSQNICLSSDWHCEVFVLCFYRHVKDDGTEIFAWSTIEMAQTENLCPLSAPHQQLLSVVRTATAFVVVFTVRVRTASQTQSFTPQHQLPVAPPHLKHYAPHNTFLWVYDLPINLAVSILPHSIYFASLVIALLELFCL